MIFFFEFLLYIIFSKFAKINIFVLFKFFLSKLYWTNSLLIRNAQLRNLILNERQGKMCDVVGGGPLTFHVFVTFIYGKSRSSKAAMAMSKKV